MTQLNSPKGYTRWWIEFSLCASFEMHNLWTCSKYIYFDAAFAHSQQGYICNVHKHIVFIAKWMKWMSSSLRVKWYHTSQLVISILKSPFMTNSLVGFPVKTTNNLLNDKVFSAPHFFSFSCERRSSVFVSCRWHANFPSLRFHFVFVKLFYPSEFPPLSFVGGSCIFILLCTWSILRTNFI